jgi:hypothetical protein
VFPLQQPAPRQYPNIPILLGDSQVLQILRVGSDNGHGRMDSRRNYFREYRGHGKSYSPAAAAATTANAEGASSSGIEIGYGFQLPEDCPTSSLHNDEERSLFSLLIVVQRGRASLIQRGLRTECERSKNGVEIVSRVDNRRIARI